MICGVETPPFWQHYNFSGSSHLCIKAQLDGLPRSDCRLGKIPWSLWPAKEGTTMRKIEVVVIEAGPDYLLESFEPL